MSSKQIIVTDNAPAAIGPYSQAVCIGNFIYTSGQIPINPQTGTIPDRVAEQTKQTLENLKAVLEAAGAGLHDVVKTTVFIADMDDFAIINDVYAAYFGTDYPARSCIEAARLPKDVRIEIEAVAVKP